tara:strand:+ start:3099 stop:4118 length:1020 start_codon:yes stop_codon:yes gene_type:complete
MGHYIKHKENYWKRKVFNEKNNFDLDLLKYSDLDEEKSKQLFKKYVELVCLEMSYYCNRACNYCPVATLERDDKKLEIPDSVLDSVINSLKEINYDGRISLNLFNEPLASRNIYNNISKISEKLPKAILSLNSNGDYIRNIKWLEKLNKSGLKEILITMHPPRNKDWEREYCENQFKRFAKKIDHNLNKSELENLKFSFFVDKLFVEVVGTDWGVKGNPRGGEIKNLIPKNNRINPCEKPMREFVISYDGTVQLCCHVYHNKDYSKQVISKISEEKKQSIFKIYTSKALSLSRKNLFDYEEKKGICQKCNHYETNFRKGEEFFVDEKDKTMRQEILNKI